MVFKTTSLILLQRCHCSSLIFICTNKIVMNIWILYYSILFLHISILYNFICLIFFLLFYTILFFKIFFNYHGWTYKRNSSIGIFKRVGTNLLHMLQSPTNKSRQWFTDGNIDRINLSVYFRELKKHYCICHYHRWKYTDGIFPAGIFFCTHFPSIKPLVFNIFLPIKLAINYGITDERCTDGRISLVNSSLQFSLIEW